MPHGESVWAGVSAAWWGDVAAPGSAGASAVGSAGAELLVERFPIVVLSGMIIADASFLHCGPSAACFRAEQLRSREA